MTVEQANSVIMLLYQIDCDIRFFISCAAVVFILLFIYNIFKIFINGF